MADEIKDVGTESKLFSQEDVNRIMADNKRSLQAENVALRDQVGKLVTGQEAMQKQWEEFQNMIAEVAGDEGGADDASDAFSRGSGSDTEDEVTKRLAWLQKKHQGELDALRQTVETEKKLRLDAEQRRLLTERDAVLQEALSDNDVVSVEGGMKIFRDSLYYDSDAGKWKYRAKDGLTFDVKEGVSEEMPDWLKKPSTIKGGSGSQAALVGAIDSKVSEVKTAQERAAKTGDTNDIAIYQRRKRELDALNAQAGAGGRR